MVSDERIAVYLRSLETDNKGLLGAIEQQAVTERVPIIRKETQSLLRVLLRLARPQRILEIGTAVGFSSLLMAGETPAQTTITTIENYPPRLAAARENIDRAGLAARITLLAGDALALLPTLAEPFDFIFLDAAKAQYIAYLPELLRLLTAGGLLLTDNVLQAGTVCESRYAVQRRDRTIHERMREYLYEIKHNELLTTAILPVGDGVACSIKEKRSC